MEFRRSAPGMGHAGHSGQTMNNATNDSRWEEVVHFFQKYCVAKRANCLAEVEQLFTTTLSRAIAAWSLQTPGLPETKRARLYAMFAVEQKRFQETTPQERFPATAAVDTAPSADRGSLPRPTAPASRIRFDDVPAALDHVLAEQRQAAISDPVPA